MGIDFPISPEALLTIFGSALAGGVIGLWVKHYLPDWRFTNLLVLILCEVFVITAQVVATSGQPTGGEVFIAFLIGFFGASVATFGYEVIANFMGFAGYGKRSDTAAELEAKKVLGLD
jgi:hypothetical protein